MSEIPIEDDQETIEHQENQEDLKNEKISINEHPIFSRIDSNTKIICNFCKSWFNCSRIDIENLIYNVLNLVKTDVLRNIAKLQFCNI